MLTHAGAGAYGRAGQRLDWLFVAPLQKAPSMSPAKPFEFRSSGSIEFEALDPVALAEPEKAAAAATPPDDTLDHDPLSINFGRKKDIKASSVERMLSGPAIDWFVGFPADARPKALCDQYPHVANRLAALWPQRSAVSAALQQIVADPRWGSAGFPGQVHGELKRLQARATER